MPSKIRLNKKKQKNIAKQRINKLFNVAEKKALEGEINFSNRYVELARKLSMKYLIPIPSEFKYTFCKHCYQYLISNKTSRVRIKRGKILIYCSRCNKFTRIPLKSKK
jgi:ribonuclease P protein subunit RPR2